MRKKSPIAVFIALVFALALASPALVADAAGPASRDYDKMKQPVAPAPINPNVKAFVNDQKNPNPQAVKPVAPSAKPPAPAQPPRTSVNSPGPSPRDAKKNATFVNKVNTAPGATPAVHKKPITSYDRTARDLGH